MSDNEIPKLEIVKLVEIKCTVKSNLIHGIGYPHYKIENVKARDLALAKQLPELCNDCIKIYDQTDAWEDDRDCSKCVLDCPVRLVKEALSHE